MPNDIRHERNRWAYMSESDLLRRLRRITNREKLDNFLLLARERGNRTLIVACVRRMNELGFASPPVSSTSTSRTSSASTGYRHSETGQVINPDATTATITLQPGSFEAPDKPPWLGLGKPKPEQKPKVRRIRFLKGNKKCKKDKDTVEHLLAM